MIKFLRTTAKKNLKGTALLRLDFNTEDEWRMEALMPTILFLSRVARAVVIVSHRGRPAFIKITVARRQSLRRRSAGKPNGVPPELSLKKDAVALGKMLKKEVRFIPHFRFAEIKREIQSAPQGSLFLLENIRFLKSEMTPRPELARKLASLADYFVNDAFAVSHRVEDSVTGMGEFLPSYAGLGLAQEIEMLSKVRVKPKKPFVIILGGGKAKDKLGVITAFKNKADTFLLGGAAANTFLFLRGVDVGVSKMDRDIRDLHEFKKIATMKKVITPVDWKEKNGAIFDIGTKTVAEFKKHIASARTILWSGPMGLIEVKPFEEGTRAIARAITKNKRALTIAGGGETVMFLKKCKLDKNFSFISTGGGAMLEFLAGEKLSGIEALKGKRVEDGK
ncbi:MAG: phosphoglycerate kinase [Patescibacteria group bacterium]|nr:phosphoglycerate kinase [Patescibacteria group bacterium]